MKPTRRANKRRATLVGLLAVGVGAVVVWWLWQPPASPTKAPPPVDLSLVTAPKKPKHPPRPGDPVREVPMPRMPKADPAELKAAYDQAKAEGKPPGEAAFRRMIAKFMEYNAEFARAQAAKEGITVDEVAELTYLGYMVLATQQPSEIEDLTGKPLDDEQREQLASIKDTRNAAFKEQLRDLVAKGRPESERWDLIRATEAGYREDLFAVTGLDAELLDALLAGDITRTGAPITSEYPEHVTPQPYVPDRPRPGEPPR